MKFILGSLLVWQTLLVADVESYLANVCVYGGTASGVMTAVAAKKEGMSVILIEPSRWLGGMTGGGISNLDWGRRESVGGSTYEILRGQPGNEVYRKTFRELINKHGIQVIYNHRLGKVNRSEKSIQSIHLDFAPVDPTGCPIPEPKRINALTVDADVFIDCSYEGDLMARSGVSYTWGRESSQNTENHLRGSGRACRCTTLIRT